MPPSLKRLAARLGEAWQRENPEILDLWGSMESKTGNPGPPTGAGSELKAIFARYGLKPCKRCLALARAMDKAGPTWCRENLEKLVSEIEAEAKRRGWLVGLLARFGVRRAVLEAIKRAENAG